MREEPKRLAVRPREAAEMIGVHVQTILSEVKKGNLVASRIGKRILIEVEEIEKYLRRNRT